MWAEQGPNDREIYIGRIGFPTAGQEKEVEDASRYRDKQHGTKLCTFSQTFLTIDLVPVIKKPNQHVAECCSQANQQERPLLLLEMQEESSSNARSEEHTSELQS